MNDFTSGSERPPNRRDLANNPGWMDPACQGGFHRSPHIGRLANRGTASCATCNRSAADFVHGAAGFRWFSAANSFIAIIVLAAAKYIRAPRHDPEAFTIYVVGGSTAEGAPYYGEVDFGSIAALMYGGELNGRKIRVENLSASSMPAQFVLEQAQAIARGVKDPDSALVFIYSGNNEFLEHDVTQDVTGRDTRCLLDTAVVPEDKRERILKSYRDTLDEAIRLLQLSEIPLILSTVAVNQKDWEPNRSVLTNSENASRINRLWSAAGREILAERWERARQHLDEIIDVEPRFAHACFWLGQVYLKLDEIENAKRFFKSAIDNDGNPTRAVSVQNDTIRELCRSHGVPLVDAEAVLENASPAGLIGYNLMWDNCHPTLGGYVLIGREFGEQIAGVTGMTPSTPKIFSSSVQEQLLKSDPSETNALADRAQYCYVNSLMTWDGGPRLNRAEQYLAQATAQRPNDADMICSLGVVQLLQANVTDSLATWKRAYSLNPERTRQRVNDPNVRKLFGANRVDDPMAVISDGLS